MSVGQLCTQWSWLWCQLNLFQGVLQKWSTCVSPGVRPCPLSNSHLSPAASEASSVHISSCKDRRPRRLGDSTLRLQLQEASAALTPGRPTWLQAPGQTIVPANGALPLRRILSLFPVFVSVSSPGFCLYAPRPCGVPPPPLHGSLWVSSQARGWAALSPVPGG